MFDLYFQSGEFTGDSASFWADLIVEISGAFVGALTAIYVFVRQNRNAKKAEIASKKNYEIQKLEYLRYLVQKSIATTNSFIDELLRLSKIFVENPNNWPDLKMPSFKELDILVNKINQEDYFFAYKNQIGDNYIMNIFSGFDIIEGNKKIVLESLQKAQLFDYERKIAFKGNLEQIIDELQNILKRLKKDNLETDKAFVFFDNILINYVNAIETNPRNMYQFREVIFKPVLDFTLVTRKEYNYEFDSLTQLVSKANKSLKNFELYNQSKYEDLKEFGESIKELINELREQSIPLLKFNNSETISIV